MATLVGAHPWAVRKERLALTSWKLVVSPLNAPEDAREVAVSAENWLSALRAARHKLGEEGGLPAGASCVMSATGEVTILDSASRRRFVLSRAVATSDAAAPASRPPVRAPSSAPPAGPQAGPGPTSPQRPPSTFDANVRPSFRPPAVDAATGFDPALRAHPGMTIGAAPTVPATPAVGATPSQPPAATPQSQPPAATPPSNAPPPQAGAAHKGRKSSRPPKRNAVEAHLARTPIAAPNPGPAAHNHVRTGKTPLPSSPPPAAPFSAPFQPAPVQSPLQPNAVAPSSPRTGLTPLPAAQPPFQGAPFAPSPIGSPAPQAPRPISAAPAAMLPPGAPVRVEPASPVRVEPVSQPAAPRSEPPAPMTAPRRATTAYSAEESANIRAQLLVGVGQPSNLQSPAAPSPAAPSPAAPSAPTTIAGVAPVTGPLASAPGPGGGTAPAPGPRKATMAYSADESASIRAALSQAARGEAPAAPPAAQGVPVGPSNGIFVAAPNLQNESGGSPTNASGPVPAAPAPANHAPNTPPGSNAPPRKTTIAYSPHDSAALQALLNAKNNEIPTGTSRVTGPAVEAPRSAHVAPANGPPVRKGTMAYSSEESAAIRDEISAAQRNEAAFGTAPTLPPAADVNASVPSSTSAAVVTMLSRDVEPTAASPLLYRERCYYAPQGVDSQGARALLTQELLGLQRSLAGRDRGILVSLALFDHFFEVRPERGPIATLEWKDWRGEPTFAWLGGGAGAPSTTPSMRPVEVEQSPHESGIRAPSAAIATPLAAAPTNDPWAGRDVTGEQDRRLAHAFEAAQDLYFLGSVADGLDFGVKLLSELIPCEAISGCLYDINTNEFRFVALTGPGADERRAQAVPATSGIMGAAAHAPGDSLHLHNATADERYDPSVDGRSGVSPRTMLVFPMRSGESLLGMLQLVNRERRDFSDGDVAVGAYVAKQVGEFLQTKRATARQPR